MIIKRVGGAKREGELGENDRDGDISFPNSKSLEDSVTHFMLCKTIGTK